MNTTTAKYQGFQATLLGRVFVSKRRRLALANHVIKIMSEETAFTKAALHKSFKDHQETRTILDMTRQERDDLAYGNATPWMKLEPGDEGVAYEETPIARGRQLCNDLEDVQGNPAYDMMEPDIYERLLAETGAKYGAWCRENLDLLLQMQADGQELGLSLIPNDVDASLNEAQAALSLLAPTDTSERDPLEPAELNDHDNFGYTKEEAIAILNRYPTDWVAGYSVLEQGASGSYLTSYSQDAVLQMWRENETNGYTSDDTIPLQPVSRSYSHDYDEPWSPNDRGLPAAEFDERRREEGLCQGERLHTYYEEGIPVHQEPGSCYGDATAIVETFLTLDQQRDAGWKWQEMLPNKPVQVCSYHLGQLTATARPGELRAVDMQGKSINMLPSNISISL